MKKRLFCILGLMTTNYILNSDDHPPKAVIVIFNALYRPNEAKMEQHIRKTLGLWYGFRLFVSGIPSADNVRDELLSVLQNVPLLTDLSIKPESWQTSDVLWDRNHPFPPILNQHLISDSPHEEAKICNYVQQAIQNNKNIKKTHRAILQGVSDFLFQSKYMNSVMEPSAFLMQFLQNLQNKGYIIILAANVPGYSWDQFLAHEPQAQIIKQLFSEDRRYISGKMHQLPTSPACLHLILEEHHLQPEDCVIIANHPKDVLSAQKIGMHAYIFDDKKQKRTEQDPQSIRQDMAHYVRNKVS